MRVLITSLSTYSAPYNDGKLEQVGARLGSLTTLAGDRATLWGGENRTRSGPGFQVVVLPLRLARSNATAQLVGLNAFADAVRPTIVHIECEPWQGVAVQSLKLAERLGVPVGISFAENGPRLNGIGGSMRRARGSRVLRRCDYAVGWSAGSTRVAEQLAPGIRTETFPATGVSLKREATGSPDHWFGAGSRALPKLAFVGRFAEEKGIGDFLAVCDELANRMPLRVAIAGGEGKQRMVRLWIQEKSWAHLHGVVPRAEVSSLLAAADALVCPSRTTRFAQEQFGKAAVEAMAVGTPVFAYDCGALPEVIGSGGVVVPEGARGQLVGELERYLARSPNDLAALRQEARNQAAQFTDEVLANKLISLWSAYDRRL